MGNCHEEKKVWDTSSSGLWKKHLAIGNFIYNVQNAQLGMLMYHTQENIVYIVLKTRILMDAIFGYNLWTMLKFIQLHFFSLENVFLNFV